MLNSLSYPYSVNINNFHGYPYRGFQIYPLAGVVVNHTGSRGWKTRDGYWLIRNKKGKQFYIHKLIYAVGQNMQNPYNAEIPNARFMRNSKNHSNCEYFTPSLIRMNGLKISHKDGNLDNNIYRNLEARVTKEEYNKQALKIEKKRIQRLSEVENEQTNETL